jgi:hypothetical protein
MKFAICHVVKFGTDPLSRLASMSVVYGNASHRPFEFVAVIEADSLGEAFQRSQNGIPSPDPKHGGQVIASWCPAGAGIETRSHRYLGARSTSVHDVIVTETGEIYSVEPVGFHRHDVAEGYAARAAEVIRNTEPTRPFIGSGRFE